MDKEMIRNEMLYQMSIQPAKNLLEKRVISKAEFNKIRTFLLEKYNPITPSLLGL